MVFRKIYAGIVRNCFLGINTQQYDCARPQTCSYQKFLFYDTIQSLSGFFHGAFHRLLLFTKKYFSHQSFRTCPLRHEIRTIKTRPNNPLRFLQRKNSIRRYLANDLTCAARKTTLRTRKRFHNKQYTPKSKDQPFESKRTHFDIGFNNGSITMHRQTFIFLLSHKITTVQ